MAAGMHMHDFAIAAGIHMHENASAAGMHDFASSTFIHMCQ
jgi:hypothetical protein